MDQKVTIETTGPLFDGSAPEAFQEAADEFVVEVTNLLAAEVMSRTPVGVFGAQGGLLGGIYGEPYQLGTPEVYGVVGHQANRYGDVVELGRQPGGKMPPKGSLIRWIEVVMGADRHTAERLDYVIRRKIAQKGTKGAHMFDEAFRNSEDRITRIAEDKGLVLSFRLGGEG